MSWLIPHGGYGEKPPAEVSNVSDAQSSSGASSFSFTSQAFGTVATNRKLVLAVSTADYSDSNVTVVTIGGISASLAKAQASTNGAIHTAIWQADVPTGTSGTIAVTLGNTSSGCGISLFRVVNAGTGPTAASDTGGAGLESAEGAVASDTLTILAGGIAIGCAMTSNSSGNVWTYLTENTDDDYEGGSHRHSSASIASAAGVTNQTITMTTPSAGNHAMALAAWGPA